MTSHGPNRKGYYHLLGVSPTAKPADIAAVYRLLAGKCHPDVGATDAESFAKFKRVTETYEVLSDAGKRRAYDRQSRPSPSVSPRVVPWEFGFAPEEALTGGPCDFTLNLTRTCGRCDGRGRIAGDLCGACQGKKTTHERRRLRLTLPPRVPTGTVIRIAGQGRQSATSVGDLLLRLRILPCW